ADADPETRLVMRDCRGNSQNSREKGDSSLSSIETMPHRKHNLSHHSVQHLGSPATYPSSYQTMFRLAPEARPLFRDASSALQCRLDVLSGPLPNPTTHPPTAQEKRQDVFSDR